MLHIYASLQYNEKNEKDKLTFRLFFKTKVNFCKISNDQLSWSSTFRI